MLRLKSDGGWGLRPTHHHLIYRAAVFRALFFEISAMDLYEKCVVGVMGGGVDPHHTNINNKKISARLYGVPVGAGVTVAVAVSSGVGVASRVSRFARTAASATSRACTGSPPLNTDCMAILSGVL